MFGQPIGVVCVFGDEPREIGEQAEQALVVLARQAASQLELRSRNVELRDVARLDPLTRLATRTLLFDRVELAVAAPAHIPLRLSIGAVLLGDGETAYSCFAAPIERCTASRREQCPRTRGASVGKGGELPAPTPSRRCSPPTRARLAPHHERTRA